MRISTPFGVRENATRKDLEEALDGLDGIADEECFVGIERDDGTFLQMRQLPIEYRGPGWPKPRRGSLPPGIREMFRSFAEGDRDWDRGMEWIEDPPPRWWARPVGVLAVALPFVALVAALLLVPRCAM